MSEYLLLRDSLRKSRNWTVVPKEVQLVEEVEFSEELFKKTREFQMIFQVSWNGEKSDGLLGLALL